MVGRLRLEEPAYVGGVCLARALAPPVVAVVAGPLAEHLVGRVRQGTAHPLPCPFVVRSPAHLTRVTRRGPYAGRRDAAVSPAAPRFGVVLGAGGMPGEAFHRGVLRALREAGVDPRTADTVVGTSAGSLVAASLRSSEARHPDSTPAPPLERPGWAPSLGTIAHAVRHPRSARVGVIATSLLPVGTTSTEVVASGVRRRFGSTWPERRTWIVACRRVDGARVVFGREDAPAADMATAVAASCAIPGYFRPVCHQGVWYVDGAVHSPTNLDLLAGIGLDLVIVSSPMSVHPTLGRPTLDAPLRLMWHRYLARERGRVQRSGTPVVTIEPSGAVLRALGVHPLRAHRIDLVEDLAAACTADLLRAPAVEGLLEPLTGGAS